MNDKTSKDKEKTIHNKHAMKDAVLEENRKLKEELKVLRKAMKIMAKDEA